MNKKEIEKMVEEMSFDDKMLICIFCEKYNMCDSLHNSKCPILIKEVESSLKEKELEKKEERLKDKVIQFPVDMDEMQKNILIELLNARKECTDQNLLTAHGCVAIIDALFYLVKEKPIISVSNESVNVTDNKSDLKSFSFVDNNEYCKLTGNYCTRCTFGFCSNRGVKYEKDE